VQQIFKELSLKGLHRAVNGREPVSETAAKRNSRVDSRGLNVYNKIAMATSLVADLKSILCQNLKKMPEDQHQSECIKDIKELISIMLSNLSRLILFTENPLMRFRARQCANDAVIHCPLNPLGMFALGMAYYRCGLDYPFAESGHPSKRQSKPIVGKQPEIRYILALTAIQRTSWLLQKQYFCKSQRMSQTTASALFDLEELVSITHLGENVATTKVGGKKAVAMKEEYDGSLFDQPDMTPLVFCMTMMSSDIELAPVTGTHAVIFLPKEIDPVIRKKSIVEQFLHCSKYNGTVNFTSSEDFLPMIFDSKRRRQSIQPSTHWTCFLGVKMLQRLMSEIEHAPNEHALRLSSAYSVILQFMIVELCASKAILQTVVLDPNPKLKLVAHYSSVYDKNQNIHSIETIVHQILNRTQAWINEFRCHHFQISTIPNFLKLQFNETKPVTPEPTEDSQNMSVLDMDSSPSQLSDIADDMKD